MSNPETVDELFESGEIWESQAPIQHGMVTCYMLPTGVRHLDEVFTFRIRSLAESDLGRLRNQVWNRFPAESKDPEHYGNQSNSGNRHEWNYYLDNDTPDVIRELITKDKHLHPVIKENLISNLETYEQGWVPRTDIKEHPHY